MSTVDVFGGYVIDIQNLGSNYYIVKWDFTGNEANFTNRIAWNVTYPFTGENPTNVRGATIEIEADIVSWITYPVYGESGALDYSTGETLWKRRMHGIQARNAHGVYDGKLYYPTDLRKVIAIDLVTGIEVWQSEETEYPWGANFAYSHASAYGNIYKLTYGGIYAFNATTGKINWHFSSGDSGMETPYGTWPFYDNIIGADGVLFAATTEHSPTQPYYRGQHLFAVDALTGEEIWRIKTTLAPAAIAEGVLLASSYYDKNLYAFSKGETATTISVSSKTIGHSESILFEGSVLDMSPAQPSTPAISDDDMSAWMEYLHMQQPKPTDATGVTVHLTAIDPNGNFQDIGYAKSNTMGNYAIDWTPPVPGVYTVTATFEGSESYYQSEAGTAFLVSEQHHLDSKSNPNQQYQQQHLHQQSLCQQNQHKPTEAPLITTDIAIFAAVAVACIIGIVSYWALRRRK